MRDGWREITLGVLFAPSNERLGTHESEPTVFSISKYDGVMPADEFFGKRVASAKLDDYKVLLDDAWVYSTIHIDEGSIARNTTGTDGVVSPMYTVMRWTSEADDPGYAELLLRSAEMLAVYSDNAQGSINRRRSLPWKAFVSIPITLPPLDEQRRIVDLIAAVDDAVDAAEAEVEAAQRTLTDIGLVANERVASGEWPTVTLAQALGSGSIMTGPFGSALHQEDYREVGTPVVMPKNIIGQRVDYDGIARIGHEDVERLTRYQTRSGDILWSRRGDVTRFAVIRDADAGSLCGTGCFIVRPEDAKVTPWLEMWMATPMVKQWLTERAVGATMANLNTSLLGGAPVADVPEEERGALVASISSLRDAADAARATAESLRTLRSNLLTVLLSGEHEIPSSYDALLGEVA